jgi:galactose-1-phosphate uridylyltransferase
MTKRKKKNSAFSFSKKEKEYLLPEESIPRMAVEFMEKVAVLDFQQIRQMDVNTFTQKYREMYLHTLTTMSDDDVHYQALILDYLYPMVRDMLELTERHRAEMKKKNEMLSE